MTRVLAIASGGGHWIELQRLKPAFADLDVAYATMYELSRLDVPGTRFYTFKDFNRFAKSSLPVVTLTIFKILWKERPHVVITTGSAPALICLAIAKFLFGAKTIWIDSIANVEKLSSSGSAARMVADAWLTQWPHLEKPDGPRYWGSVL